MNRTQLLQHFDTRAETPENPNGIPARSPGLRLAAPKRSEGGGTSYPGNPRPDDAPTPTGLRRPLSSRSCGRDGRTPLTRTFNFGVRVEVAAGGAGSIEPVSTTAIRNLGPRRLRDCLKTPPRRRVRARGLQIPAKIHLPCRPGALTGRVFKQALRRVGLQDGTENHGGSPQPLPPQISRS